MCFFFHSQLDNQPHEYALHGLLFILLFYNASIFYLLKIEKQSRENYWKTRWYSKHSSRHHHSKSRLTESDAVEKSQDASDIETANDFIDEDGQVYERRRVKVAYRERRRSPEGPKKSTGHLRKSG